MLRRLLLIVAALVLSSATPADALIPPDTACRSGEVSLTFDDGPDPVTTPRLLSILAAQRAQATFFVQGRNVARHPGIVGRMVRDGHAVEDHSWDHPDLRGRSDHSVRRQLRLTKGEIREATGRTASFYRPPYGSTDRRIRSIARSYDLREVLWTVDTRDWAGRSPRAIRRSVARGVRPHRSDVVLMHDAVGNSPATLRAVPGIVRDLRRKGYCLVPLERMMRRQVVRAAPTTATEGTVATIRVELDSPSQRRGTFRVRSQDGTANAGRDYRVVDRTVTVRRGVRSVAIRVRLAADPMPSAPKRMTLRLDRARDLRLGTTSVPVTIVDDGIWSAPTTDLVLSTARTPATLGP